MNYRITFATDTGAAGNALGQIGPVSVVGEGLRRGASLQPVVCHGTSTRRAGADLFQDSNFTANHRRPRPWTSSRRARAATRSSTSSSTRASRTLRRPRRRRQRGGLRQPVGAGSSAHHATATRPRARPGRRVGRGPAARGGGCRSARRPPVRVTAFVVVLDVAGLPADAAASRRSPELRSGADACAAGTATCRAATGSLRRPTAATRSAQRRVRLADGQPEQGAVGRLDRHTLAGLGSSTVRVAGGTPPARAPSPPSRRRRRPAFASRAARCRCARRRRRRRRGRGHVALRVGAPPSTTTATR